MTTDERPPGDGRPPLAGVLADGLRLAVGTLTALPVRPPSTVDRRRARVAMVVAPAVAVLPGGAAALVAELGRRAGTGPLVAAALAIGALTLATRGLHLDGLSDTADGLAASYDRARALDVMRRGNTGPAGTAALVLVLLLQVTALSRGLTTTGSLTAVAGVVAGRLALPLACVRGVPAARPDGLGAAMAGSVPRVAAAATGLLAAVVTGALAAGGSALTGGLPAATGAALGVLAAAASALAAGLLVRRAVGRFGGITGDVLGACVEAGTTAALVVLALTP
jgi:adenosylcobinamide-GDP ribazoletransferase